MSSTDGQPPRGTPAVGNILGFGLLFRERRALLALPRRGLAPGVKVRDYEAEIPGVELPIKGPLSATAFRTRRCLALKATLAIEARGLRPLLDARLVGGRVDGLRVVSAELDLRAKIPGTPGHRPCLYVELRRRDGGLVWLMVGLQLSPRGRRIVVAPSHLWLVGRHDPGRDALWAGLARRLAGRNASFDRRRLEIEIDPAKLALTRPFVGAGWRAPDLRRLELETLTLSRRALTLELRAGDTEGVNVQPDPPAEDPIAQRFDDVRERLRRGESSRALAELESITGELFDAPAAQLAVVRWRVELARWRDAEATGRALRDWLDLQPSAHRPRRMLAVQLARMDDAAGLARLLAADCRSAHPAPVQARLELALATVLVERLDDPRSALGIVGPLVARLRGRDDVPAEVLPNALVCLAQARAAESGVAHRLAHAPHAIEALDEALSLVDDPPRRADFRARVARTFGAQGAHATALRLLMAAIQEAPDNIELLDDAIDLSLTVDEREAAADLLRVRIDATPAAERVLHRRRLADVLLSVGTPAARSEALDALRIALDHDPENPDLLDACARLEAEMGDPAYAAELTARRLDDPRLDLEGRRRALLDRASWLRDAGDLDHAWETLRPTLHPERESTDAPNVDADLDMLELALELAPPTDRDRILDRIIEQAQGSRRARALIERSAQTFDIDTRLADLWAAADALDDPREVLPRLEELISEDQLRELEQLAEMADQAGDEAMAARARARLGRSLAANEQWESAAQQLERVHRAGRAGPGLRLLLADCWRRSGRTRPAFALLRASLEEGEERPDLYQSLAPLPERLAQSLELAAELGEDEALVRLMERWSDHLRGAELRAARWLHFRALEGLGDLSASRAFVDARLEDPSVVRDPGQRIEWLREAARLSHGAVRIQHLEDALRLDPDDPVGVAALRAALRDDGRIEDRVAFLCGRLDRLAETGVEDEAAAASIVGELLDELGDARLARAGLDPERRRGLHEFRLSLHGLDPETAIVDHLAATEFAAATGDDAAAVEHARAAYEALSPRDPRRRAPALRLATAAVAEGAYERARTYANVASKLWPDGIDRRPLADLQLEVARELDDPGLRLEALEVRIATPDADDPISSLELEAAAARIALGHGDAAFTSLRRVAENVTPGSDLQLQLAELWLGAARRWSMPEEERLARAQLRIALGSELSAADLVTELRLNFDVAPRLPAASTTLREVLGHALVERDDLEAFAESLDALEEWDANLALSTFEAALGARADGPATSLLAERTAHLAGRLERPQACLRALERSRGDADVDPELARLRDWAVVELGVVDDEVEAIRLRLAESPRPPLLLTRLGRLLPEPAVFAQLVGAARSLDPAPASELVLLGFDACAHRERDDELQAVELLAQHCIVESSSRSPAKDEDPTASKIAEALEHWWVRIADTLDGDDHEGLTRLVALTGDAGIPETLRKRARSRLESALRRAPDAPPLLDLVWKDAQAGEWVGEGERSKARALQRFSEALAPLARELAPSATRRLLAAAAERLEAEARVEWLAAFARRLKDDRDRRASVFELLAEAHAWSALCELLPLDLEGPDAVDAARWADLAAHARSEGDDAAELRARLSAAKAWEAAGEPSRAADALGRALELEDRPELRWRRAEGLEAAERIEEARAEFLALHDAGEWSAAGVERAVLAERAGRLCLEVDDAMAVLLLEQARTRVRDDEGEEGADLADLIFGALLRLGRNDAAVELARDCATRVRSSSARRAWLERAYAHAEGRMQIELGEALYELDPARTELLRGLTQQADELEDAATAHRYLRLRLEREPDAADEILARLIRDLEAERPRRDVDELAQLRRRWLDAHPDDLDQLLAMANHHRARGEDEARDEYWRRAFDAAEPTDPRLADAALQLGLTEAESGDPGAAERYLARAQALSPRDRRPLDTRLALARRGGDDAALVARLVEAIARSPQSAVRGTLRVELARARARRHEVAAAATAWSKAVEELEDDLDARREAARAWLDWVYELNPDERGEALELDAHGRVHDLEGVELSRAEAEREVDLLQEAGRSDKAMARVESYLFAAPTDGRWVQRLAELGADAIRERYLPALRRIVEGIEAGDARDTLAIRLIEAARAAEAARTAWSALSALSPEAAAREDMLDAREWAVRSLGRVDDELGEIEARLAAGMDPVALIQLMRMVERDAIAAAKRLLHIEGGDDATRRWRLEQALLHAAQRPREGLDIILDALPLAVRLGATGRESVELATRTLLAAESHEAARRLLEIRVDAPSEADEGERRRWELRWGRPALDLAAELLTAFPEDVRLHELTAELIRTSGSAADLAEAGRVEDIDDRRQREWLHELAERAGLDLATRVQLHEAHAAVLPAPARYLAALARNPPAFDDVEQAATWIAAIDDALRTRNAWSTLAELFGEREHTEAREWEALADEATRGHADPEVRLRALDEAARAFSRTHRPRDAVRCLDAALEQLAAQRDRARSIPLRRRRCLALDASGDAPVALAAWRELLREGLADDPLQSSRRAASLAREVGDGGAERELLEMALTHAAMDGRLDVHAELADALFEAHRRDGADAAARALARAMADQSRGPGHANWLRRAAELSEGESRAGYLFAALEADPDDETVATELQGELRRAGDFARLRDLLEARAGHLARRDAPPRELLALWESSLDTFDAVPSPPSPSAETLAALGIHGRAPETAEGADAPPDETTAGARRPAAEALEAAGLPDDPVQRRQLARALAGVLRIQPERAELRLRLAELRRLEGDLEAALTHYRQAGEQLADDDIRFFVPALRLAEREQQRGELDAASQHLERARGLAPDLSCMMPLWGDLPLASLRC